MIFNYIIIGAGGGLILLLLAVKFIFFNKDRLSPVVNFEAQNAMGPLVMGKLIDNRVDKSDVTPLIFFWASKGYLKINLSKTGLVRTQKSLPDGAPTYQKIMFNKLFENGDEVKISDLTNKFYPTVESVIKEVNAENSRLYCGKSMMVAVLFALVAALALALTPIIIAITGNKRILITPTFMIIPVFVIFSLTQTVRYNGLKLKKGWLALFYIAIILLAAGCSSAYILLLPHDYIAVIPKILLCAFGFAIAILSAFIISRTQAYAQKLNRIVGFRKFILQAEKERLLSMLDGNPEFYYQVLPYAQVLGVADIWESKFAEIPIAPPSWLIAPLPDGDFDFAAFNCAVRSANAEMTAALLSRPLSHIL